jgi:uroporphyrinogen III methyltransferase/synthase
MSAERAEPYERTGEAHRVGRVYLVGAGPGDPGLLTVRARDLIASADTILYDRLIPAQALDGARANAELLFVGKQGGGESVPQEQTLALMIEQALAGREVVRLKGGDPFVFGRGGEEALALREAGIEFAIVPGVTAGVAAAAYAGIPVTQRGVSTGVALVTGHEDPEKPEQELDWDALAAFPGTLVFYMGVRQLKHIAKRLIAAGRAPSQAAALVERGTLPDQRTVTGTLATIAEVARREQVKAPAITLVGEVVELAGSLEWLPERAPVQHAPSALDRELSPPHRALVHSDEAHVVDEEALASSDETSPLDAALAGRTVAVTRARARASELALRLERLGARVVQAPTIRTHALDGPPLNPAPYDLICLTSPTGVECLFERLDDTIHPPGDARALAGARIAAIGPGTARALAEHGIVADVIPKRFVAESLVEALGDVEAPRALVARAKQARDVLPDALRARGAQVDVVALYETVAEPLSQSALAQARAADYITFTSASTVRFFFEAAAACGSDAATARGVDDVGDWRGDPPTGAGGRTGVGDWRGRPLTGARGATDTTNEAATGRADEGAECLEDPAGVVLTPATRIVSIGPVTSAALREHGLTPDVEADKHDIEGLVDALVADALACRASSESASQRGDRSE